MERQGVPKRAAHMRVGRPRERAHGQRVHRECSGERAAGCVENVHDARTRADRDALAVGALHAAVSREGRRTSQRQT
jgi:hypothetical protein